MLPVLIQPPAVIYDGRYDPSAGQATRGGVSAPLTLFCGCLCGMAFQEASQMYHCVSCDALTDFSEFDRHDDEPDD